MNLGDRVDAFSNISTHFHPTTFGGEDETIFSVILTQLMADLEETLGNLHIIVIGVIGFLRGGGVQGKGV